MLNKNSLKCISPLIHWSDFPRDVSHGITVLERTYVFQLTSQLIKRIILSKKLIRYILQNGNGRTVIREIKCENPSWIMGHYADFLRS